MKKILILLVIVSSILFTGCLEPVNDADKQMRERTEQAMAEMNAQIGMPAIKNFQERKLAKMIFELRDKEDLITYAYIVNLNGDLIFIGECIGFGLPYSVQYTNPEKRIGDGVDGEIATIPQADPNGLFMPEGLSATGLMMIDPETGESRPGYFEPQVMVSPFKLH
jgi:hypothetical protein